MLEQRLPTCGKRSRCSDIPFTEEAEQNRVREESDQDRSWQRLHVRATSHYFISACSRRLILSHFRSYLSRGFATLKINAAPRRLVRRLRLPVAKPSPSENSPRITGITR